MNKQKRKILNCRARLVKKIASQMGDFKHSKAGWSTEQIKVLTKLYEDNACLPSRARNIIFNMSVPKLNKLFQLLKSPKRSYGLQVDELHGCCFYEKLTICCFITHKDWFSAKEHHTEYLKNHPAFQD